MEHSGPVQACNGIVLPSYILLLASTSVLLSVERVCVLRPINWTSDISSAPVGSAVYVRVEIKVDVQHFVTKRASGMTPKGHVKEITNAT